MQLVLELIEKTQYRMVFVSFISISVYLLGIFGFRKLFPNKKISYFLLLIGFSVLPLISIFRSGSYESGDLTINVAKLISFYNSLQEGILIPRWAGELNATYGYPNFIFAYPLPYYLGSLFHFVGFSYIASIKLILINSYVLSGVCMFFWLKKHVTEKSAFIGSILYLFAPYHLIDMHFRVDIGEMMALVFLPLTFYFIDKISAKNNFVWNFLCALSISFLILSHQAVSLLAVPIIICYILFTGKKVIELIVTVLIGLLYSAYYWLPVLIESKFTLASLQFNEVVQYPHFWELIFSPYRYGFLYQGPQGQLSLIIGYAHILIIAMSIYLLLRRKATDSILFFLFLTIVYILLMLAVSEPVWNNLPYLKNIEFPMRILSIVIFTTSALAAFAFEKLTSNQIFKIILVIAVGTSILNWGNRKNLPDINDSVINSSLSLYTANGEGLYPAAPIWTESENPWRSVIPNSHIESISGKTDIVSEKRSITNHHYIINVKSNSVLIENTLYFPGWNVFVDGVNTKIDYQNPKFPGVITFNVSEGLHSIELIFKDTPIRKYSLILSLISLFLSGVFLICVSKLDTSY